MEMKIYDKASWHIDGGEKTGEVVARFKIVFSFLQEMKLLNDEGIEIMEAAMDDSVSLNSSLVTAEGKSFLDSYYDELLKKEVKDIKKNLSVAYKTFIEKKQ